MATSRVIHCTSKDQYDQIIKDANGGLVVIDFSASWCGPCRRIAPAYDTLSAAETSVTFVKIDVDEVEEVASAERVSGMPTFVFYKNGARSTEVVGANIDKVKNNIANLK